MNRQKLVKWSLFAGKLAVVALLVWVVRGSVESAFSDLRQHTLHIAWHWLVVAGVLYLLGITPAGEYWHQVMLAAEQPLPRYASLRSYFVSQIGKYVPGKAMVLVLRTATVRPWRVPTTIVTLGVILETLTNMADGSLVAMLILAPHLIEKWQMFAAASAMFLVTALPIVPPLFNFGLRVTGLVKLNPGAIKKFNQLDRRTMAWGWLSMAAGWWLQGLALWAVLHSFGAAGSNPLINWPLHTAVTALSVVAGFLGMFPGGLGIREFVIVELFKPVYGDVGAVVAAILLRLVSVVSDALISIILYFIRPAGPKNPDPVGAEPLEAGSNC